MKKITVILVLLNIAYFKTLGQEPCTYTPLLFEELSPLWSKVIVDSTIIGYQDPDPISSYEYSGHNHLSWDIGSFVDGDFLYGISEIEITGDIAGALIEKINLNTGVLIWQISNDLRTSEYREKVLSARVQDDMFIVSGIREEISNELSISLEDIFFVGKSEGKVFERIYDLETGIQILYTTPSKEDSLASNFKFIPWVFYNYFFEKTENYLDARDFATGKGTYLIRREIDSLGRLENGPDTLVTGRFKDRLLLDAIHVAGPRFIKNHDGNFLYIEQYSPRENVNHSFEAFISEYDKEFNLIKERNLKDFGLEQFSLIQIINTAPNYILLRGCYNVDAPVISNCESFCLVLDKNFELIDKFDLVDSEGVQYSFLPQKIRSAVDGKHLIPITQFSLNSKATVDILQSNTEGVLENLKKLTILNNNQVTSIDYMNILENGDFLFKFRHSCYENGIRIGEFREWQRMDANDFISSLNTNEDGLSLKYDVLPNPFNDFLKIDNFDRTITEVNIINTYGMIVKKQKTSHESIIHIDTSKIEAGYYFLKLSSSHNKAISVGIVKF